MSWKRIRHLGRTGDTENLIARQDRLPFIVEFASEFSRNVFPEMPKSLYSERSEKILFKT